MSWGTPLVYFMGIEENRKMAQEHFRANMRVFSKNKVSTENTKPSENYDNKREQTMLEVSEV